MKPSNNWGHLVNGIFCSRSLSHFCSYQYFIQLIMLPEFKVSDLYYISVIFSTIKYFVSTKPDQESLEISLTSTNNTLWKSKKFKFLFQSLKYSKSKKKLGSNLFFVISLTIQSMKTWKLTQSKSSVMIDWWCLRFFQLL